MSVGVSLFFGVFVGLLVFFYMFWAVVFVFFLFVPVDVVIHPLGDILVDAVESPAADKQDVFGVDHREFLFGMLAATLRGNVHQGAFQ